jgi:VWFA-related protein
MKIKPSHCLVLSLAAVPLLLGSQAAQQPPAPSTDQPVTTLKVQSREVLLPVTVLDKHNQLVTNLTAKDFTLTEDSRPQVIKSFTTESNMPFRLGLLVDTSRSVYGAIDAERKAADKFIDLMLPPDPKATASAASSSNATPTWVKGDEAFLIHFDREVELLEDFTNSREKLDREIDQMTPTSQERNNQGPETSGGNNGGYGGGGRQQGSAMHGAGTQLYDAIYLASDELMKPKDGRKALVVFSDGVDHGSKETLNDAIDAADHANVQVFTIYFKGEEEQQNNGYPGHHGGMGGGYPGGGYPGGGYPGGGYPGGGYPGGGGRGGNREPGPDGKKIMEQIATRTGGQYFEAKKKDNLDEIYSQIATVLRQQYLLTYTPDKVDTDGEFHKIVLKADKTDLNVITREGYYAPTSDK